MQKWTCRIGQNYGSLIRLTWQEWPYIVWGMGRVKSVTERLETARKLMPMDRVQAVIMAGLGYSTADIAAYTGLDAALIGLIRSAHGPTLASVRANPDEARTLALVGQRDSAIMKGLALSHTNTLTPSALRQLASAHAILAKSAPPPAPARAQDKQPPAPSRPK